ncbi:glycoside hydrolase family 43 protein [Isoptericola sp. 4D.3]|uniref:Glycoside hydrolase family 43 protein n=1 Tax=Isoptericola peretonis TaxID=2918523 RepID=A0ABT0J583_9MICO|nr:glycoside hydrolase family 43 protein [Isoptericola sp. 4D.3]
MRADDPYGYLLVHFVEDRAGHGERVHLSLSEGDDPLRWRRLNDGAPVLETTAGTGGVRDPHLVRRPDGEGFHLVATDLRVWRPEGPDWEEFRRHGSRDVVVWDSPDLRTWSAPRHVTVAPPDAGMAWAPEAFHDEDAGVFVLHFAAALYAPDDPRHEGACVPRILTTTTRDFRTFTPAEPYLELPGGVIDMTVVRAGDQVHRFAKQDDDAPGSWRVFHQVGPSLFDPGFRTLATGLGQGFGPAVEGPLVFPTHDGSRWYLWVDQYGRPPQGYRALTTTDLASGEWEPVPDEELHLPPHTKHGAVLPLQRGEWKGLARL